jgi:hypothetical protein
VKSNPRPPRQPPPTADGPEWANLGAGFKTAVFTMRADGGRSCCLVSGFDAVLAKQVPQQLHLAAQALDLLGQGRQVRVGGFPLMLAGGLAGEQLRRSVRL